MCYLLLSTTNEADMGFIALEKIRFGDITDFSGCPYKEEWSYLTVRFCL